MCIPDSLRAIFEQLDRWRHLPAYKLEPRADAFFGIYIQHVLQQCTGKALHSVVIPELPLRRGTLYGEHATGPNRSVKVDYALFSEQLDAVYLVELKTDQASRSERQDTYLSAAVEIGIKSIIEGIIQIVRATQSQYRPKYFHLLALLEKVGVVNVPVETYTARPRDVRGCLSSIRVSLPTREPRINVWYVQPHSTGADNEIDFDRFAETLPGEDPLAKVFGEFLIRWREPAGSRSPQL